MDSGNSSSMQSSSGGDEEYESRPESVPAFFNTSAQFNIPLSSNPHPSSLVGSHHHHHHQHPPPTFFDLSSNYLNPFSHQSHQPLLNLDDGVRPARTLRSDQPDLIGNLLPAGSSSSSSGAAQSILGTAQGQGGLNNQGSSRPAVAAHDNINGVRSLTHSDHHHHQTSKVNVNVKNPKKRTRASRRAPTTVLTTDTTNFRAMVQEFTGIPAPPFSGSSYSRRLDLFGSGSGMRSSLESPLGGTSLYPLRPSAKRVQPTLTPLLNNPLVDATNNINTTTTSSNTNAFNIPTSSSNYHQLQNQNIMLNLQQNQSPVLSFQSFLGQPPTSLNLPAGFGVNSKSQQGISSGSGGMPNTLDELGLSHGHGHVNANLGGGLQSHHHGNWRDQDIHLRPNLDHAGNYGNDPHQRINNSSSCKLNYSSDHFHHVDKGLMENVSSRPEGTVDSWICPAAD